MSKHRARVSAAEYTQMGGRRVKTKAAHGYTPQNLKEYEDKIGWLLRQARVERNDVDDLGVHAVFYVRGVKLDVDNLVKALLDGCNHVAWRDDQQVTRLTAEAVRGSDEPHIDLVVYVTGRRARDCENCGKPLTASQIAGGRMFCSKGCYDRDQRRGTNRPCAASGARSCTAMRRKLRRRNTGCRNAGPRHRESVARAESRALSSGLTGISALPSAPFHGTRGVRCPPNQSRAGRARIAEGRCSAAVLNARRPVPLPTGHPRGVLRSAQGRPMTRALIVAAGSGLPHSAALIAAGSRAS